MSEPVLEAMEKQCTKCGTTKPLDEFSKSKDCKYGRKSVCKECALRENREYYKKHPGRRYEEVKRWRAKNRDKEAKYSARYQKRYPERQNARNKLHRAVAVGKITKPEICENCGGKPVQGHHDDYSKPLQVRWLCPKCDKKAHRGEI